MRAGRDATGCDEIAPVIEKRQPRSEQTEHQVLRAPGDWTRRCIKHARGGQSGVAPAAVGSLCQSCQVQADGAETAAVVCVVCRGDGTGLAQAVKVEATAPVECG
jgi:hypothetical protein